MKIRLKYIIVACVTIIYYVVAPLPEHYNAICLGLILLFGVPHGAADHRINSTLQKDSSFLSYIFKYVLIACGYVIWWVFMPGKALMIFFILSAYHFGQEFLEEIKFSSNKVWEIMIWGVVILIVPILITYQEIKPNMEFVSRAALPDIPNAVLVSLVTIFIGAAVIHMIVSHKRQQTNAYQLRRQLEMLIVLVVSFSLLPFLIAFTLYFILFHSLNAFKHQYGWLKKSIQGYTVKLFILDLSLFSFLSVFGLIILIYLISPDSWLELISYFFIIISVITLPHSILFDQFYKLRKRVAGVGSAIS